MLGEVRSLIPPDVHIMALTATAKKRNPCPSDQDTRYGDYNNHIGVTSKTKHHLLGTSKIIY